MNIIFKLVTILCLCVPSGAYAKQLIGDDFTKACSGGTKTCHLVSNDRGATWVGPFCGPCAGTPGTIKKANDADLTGAAHSITVPVGAPITGATKVGRWDDADIVHVLTGEKAGGKVTNDREKIAPAPAFQLGLGILFIQAKQTLQELAEAYSAKRRTAFMKLVSQNFSGDVSTFEDALVKDFRTYSSVNLSITPDSVVAQGDMAAVEFHYNLTVVNEQGVNKTFSGRSNYTFRDEDGKVRLYKMEKPIIFGNSLTSTENPMDAGQHSLSAAASSVPGLQSTLFGTAIVASFPCISSLPGAAFQFETQSRKTFDSTGLDRSADIFRFGDGTLRPLSGGAIVSIGNCSLGSVASAPGIVSGNSATPNVGECYAFKTGAGKYAVLRINSVELALSGCALEFSYKYQPSGSNAF
ncbi:MAG: hypothetical protein Q7R35_04890 [Elusimicrobiota bacterium]|nr:hypothetical protein [Elusimicrobiota bacterium]